MDTKNLHDWADEADLNLRDSEGYYDAQAVWIDAIMQHPESLADFWADWCFDSPADIVDMLGKMGRADSDLQFMISGRNTDNLTASYAQSAVQNNCFAGECLRRMVRRGLTKYVEKMAEEWWEDVLGYAADMQEGAREDYLYEQYRDRQLEDRT